MPLNAKSVARPSKWGNPFKVGELYPSPLYIDPGWLYLEYGMTVFYPFDEMTFRLSHDRTLVVCTDVEMAVRWFRCSRSLAHKREIRAELAGFDLACWCKVGDPCHADVLLELANQ